MTAALTGSDGGNSTATYIAGVGGGILLVLLLEKLSPGISISFGVEHLLALFAFAMIFLALALTRGDSR